VNCAWRFDRCPKAVIRTFVDRPGLDPDTEGLRGAGEVLRGVDLVPPVDCLQGLALFYVDVVSWCCRKMRPTRTSWFVILPWRVKDGMPRFACGFGSGPGLRRWFRPSRRRTQLHPAIGIGRGVKAVTAIEVVGVIGRQGDPAQALRFGMLPHRRDQELPESQTSATGFNEDVGNDVHDRVIGDQSGHPYLDPLKVALD